MEISFEFKSAKYERINQLMQLVENRLNEMSNLEKMINNDFNETIREYQNDSSELSFKIVNGLISKSFSMDGKLYSHKKEFKKINELILNTSEMITKDKNSFDSNYSNLDDLIESKSEFNNWISEGRHVIHNDNMSEYLLTAKISYQFIKPLKNNTIKNIVKINDESIHINNAMAEIKQLQQEIINDYQQDRKGIIERKSYVEKFHNIVQLLGEQMTYFNLFKSEGSVADSRTRIQDSMAIIASSHDCSGRTVMCGVTH